MLHTIAYAADESMLLTFEGKQVFAFDGATGAPLWQLEIPHPGVGIAFVPPNAFGPGPAASPWRSGMSGSTAVAVDAEGAIHLIDASVGRLVHSSAPWGAPVAIASAAGAFALAVADRVLVWRDGEKNEIAGAATAVAFSQEGVLAIANKKDGVLVGDAPPRQLDATVFALAWSARTGWLAGTDHGLLSVERRKALLEGRVRGLAIDPTTARVAIPRGDQTVMVYSWPIGTAALTKVDVKRRAIQDVAFGPNGRLGVGVNRGDAAIVDVVDQSGRMVQRHQGRDPVAWKLDVGIDPAKLPAPPQARYGKVGFGAMGALAVGARIVIALIRTSSSTSTPDWKPPVDVGKLLQCDVSCESSRLAELRKDCAAANGSVCGDDAEAAERSFMASDCDAARASLAAIENRILSHSEDSGGVYADVVLAKSGLELSCSQTIKDGLVSFDALELHPRQIELWSSNGGNGGKPFDVATDSTGRTFVTVVNRTNRQCELWRIDGVMDVQPLADDCTSAKMFSRGGDVYVAAGTSVRRVDKAGTTDLGWRGAAARLIAGSPEADGDLWITTADNAVVRYHAGKWTTETLPVSDLIARAMVYADDTLLIGGTETGHHALYRRRRGGKWTASEDTVVPNPIYFAFGSLYVGRGTEIAISPDKGATWPTKGQLPFAVTSFFARATTEVYVGGANGLLRWDGNFWQNTGFGQPLVALSGDNHKLYGIVSHHP